jgi:hypothetical protein
LNQKEKNGIYPDERRLLMPYKAMVVDLPNLRLMVTRADEFPRGIKTAWNRLESRLTSLRGRKFYGVTRCEDSQLVYFAGVVAASNEEVTALGFPTMMIKGGKYARAKLFDWPNHTDKIGEILGELMRDFPMDTYEPTLEYYRSQSELHLLIPLIEAKARRCEASALSQDA